jgi:S-adenosylmethionine hydrolase
MVVFRSFGRRVGAVLLAVSALLSPALVQAAPPPTIALFTDYGWDDPYGAQMEGAIVSINPNVRLLDLSHTVGISSIEEASFLLDQATVEFPAGTIFIAAVDFQSGGAHAPILVQTNKGKTYLGPDNGLLSGVIAREGLARAWKLDQPQYFRPGTVSNSFPGRDIFGPVAAHLAAGVDPNKMGSPLKSMVMLPLKEPNISGGIISAEVVHIDHFGNLILNLAHDSEPAAKFQQGNLVRISVGRENYSAPLVRGSSEVQKGRLALFFGASGLLEIAMNQGSAAHDLKADVSTVILFKP